MIYQSKLLIILATYNEIDNLPRLVHQLSVSLPHGDILVIDDASPDGTGNWCESAKQKYAKLNVVHREGKLGLGSAAVKGFRWAEGKDYELIATCDADLSHAVSSLVEMIEFMDRATNREIGLILGSRYVPGGGTEGWPFYRRIVSRLVNKYSKLLLRLSTKDNSGSFRVYRSEALGKLNLDKLMSSDFAYLQEILWRLNKAGVKMVEHPIIFKNRELGRSKTSLFLGVKVFWQILKMGLGIWK